MTDSDGINLEQELSNTTFTPSDMDIDLSEPIPLPTDNNNKDDFDRLLDDFIATQLQDATDTQEEILESQKNQKPLITSKSNNDELANNLYPEERRLYDACINFIDSVNNLAANANIPMPEIQFKAETIYPRFRPSRGRLISDDIIKCWNLMLEAQPIRLSSLPANATDEQLLEFAEKTTDENLQMALISYVEILIEMESCEIAYNLRKAKAKKRKIERRIYEEYQHSLEIKRRYIEAIKKKGFPIDAERLINNYFKTARKDPNGARKILENNPAIFAPIETEKLKARFFGLIKPKPEDGIRINKEIGNFLKDLRA